jgi:S1-C subfamily serine protease
MANNFLQVSEGMAEVIQAASIGVVRVEGRRRLPATGIVWSKDGLVITASHVVHKDEGINVGLPNGESVAAQLVGRDQSTDIALLRLEANNLEPISRPSEGTKSVGNLVLALGRPGKNIQATLGIISALSGSWRTQRGGQIDGYLQTDVLMYPGFSGGPLIGAEGALLGMNSSALLPGVSVTVDKSTLERVAQSLTEHGRIRRGYLGVNTQRAQLPLNLQQELGQKIGLLIISVEPDSPAEEGGLTLGDTIVGLADEPIRSHDELLAKLSADVTGQKVPVKIVRGGEILTVNVKIGERQ